jgi:pimeloyl-ACP methyl ester carboxylesterase
MSNLLLQRGQFVDLAGVSVYAALAGDGWPGMVLLHGSFLSSFSWREVFAPLSEMGKVLAFDRVTFGQTSRPLVSAQPDLAWAENPYSPEAQADLTVALMDHVGLEKAVLIGNSTGGTIALLTALRHPQRVQALVLVDAMVYSGYPVSQMPPWIRTRFPKGVARLLIRLAFPRLFNPLVRKFWRDPTQITPSVLATYRQLFQMENWEGALWELILATHVLELAVRLPKIVVPALVVTGDEDTVVPTHQSVRLSNDLPNASLAILPRCGHVPQEECPQDLLHALTKFLQTLKKP